MNHSSMQTEVSTRFSFDAFAYAYTQTGASAVFKREAEDFVVDEVLPFTLSGQGEHCWLHIRKRDSNTDWVAKQLARQAGVSARKVGYAGLKDRHGVTTQWFSVHLPGQADPDWTPLESDAIRVLEVKRHDRKLRRGALKSNRFHIRLRDVQPADRFAELQARCELIASHGVPNYFGEQRFGLGMNNLDAAMALFSDSGARVSRHQKSLYLSAARSWLFNQLLSARIEQGTWCRRLPGDVFMLDGKSACFQDDASAELASRLEQGDIHVSGPLWGTGEPLSRGAAAELEAAIIDNQPVFRDGLLRFDVQAQRRALRVIPRDLRCSRQGDDLLLAFSLPAGSYATMVLRELLHCRG